jgi:hypothetical protein
VRGVIFVTDFVPRTKLVDGHIIVLECECGVAVPYPGHPDDVTAVLCENCGRVWACDPDLPVVVGP